VDAKISTMITSELLDYIRAESTSGIDKDVISQALIGSGWSEQDVKDAFIALTPPPPAPTVPQMPTVTSSVSAPSAAIEAIAPKLVETQPVIAPVSVTLAAVSSTPTTQPASSLEAKAANIEMAYDTAVEKVSELGGEQRQIVTAAVKKLEERKIDEIKKRLIPSPNI
jgi:hypothetical protein